MVMLCIYQVVMFLLGYRILVKYSQKLPRLLLIVGAFLIGAILSVPITYVLSVTFVWTTDSLLWGVITATILSVLFLILNWQNKHERTVVSVRWSLHDGLILLSSLLVASWIAFKTFHGGMGGEVYVGSNNVFDFSHALGIIRSFSWGNNIPFMSPFQSGLPFFYHFLFYFWIGIWEHFGVPLVWSVNILSILSFSSLLIILYYLPQVVFRQEKIVGWIAVIFTLTNSSMTWWQLIAQRGLSMATVKSFWSMQVYPFAGPFDGSTISIFMTLNNYVNQRHLAFAIACSLFMTILIRLDIEQKQISWKKIIGYGVLFGLLGLWNFPIAIVSIIGVVSVHIFQKSVKLGFLFGMVAGVVLISSYGQYIPLFRELLMLGKALTGTVAPESRAWSIPYYLFMNLGILPLPVILGYFVINKKYRTFGLSFLLLGVGLCVACGIGKRGFDQKFLSFLIIWANVFAAIGVAWLWQKRSLLIRLSALVLFGLLTASGIIDLFPIKNEFAYPLIDTNTVSVISWIHTKTPMDSVFVSYADMVDPIAFAGRKNYFGFFGNLAWTDRAINMKQIYTGNLTLTHTLGISYVLVPKWEKTDFPYVVNIQYLKKYHRIAYEDERYLIFDVRSSMIQ